MTAHSIAALETLRALAGGRGGRALILRGAGGPYYAGIAQAPVDTLLEFALRWLDHPGFEEVLAITGTGPHLPALQIDPAFRVGLSAGAWRVRGGASPPPPPSPEADPDLLDLAAVRATYGTTSDRVVLAAQNAPWAERVAHALTLVEERAGLVWQGTRAVRRDGPLPRALVIVDDRFLTPRSDERAQPDGSFQSAALDARLADLTSQLGRTDLVILASADPALRWKDVPVVEAPPAASYGAFYPGARGPLAEVLRNVPPRATAGALAELDSLIGLAAVKEQVRGLVDRLREDRERRAQGLPVQDMRLHTVFYGNPGTGKTTVARLLARIFGESGLLSGQKVTEVSRGDLVGQYVGETTQKTAAVCRQALGGVLFIDEAYALHRGEGRDYGSEAVDELVKWMSDRPRDLAVILAGYPREMRAFIAGANPGLVRRFDFHLSFDDYSDAELADVVGAQARREQDDLDDAALTAAAARLAAHRAECARKGLAFGNAGDAIRLLQAARRERTTRIRARATRSRDDLARLTAEDFARATLGTGA